jgi:hypothetical protein
MKVNDTTVKEYIASNIDILSSGGSITLAAIVISLISSFVTGLLIAWVYRKAFQGVLYQKSYAAAIVMTCLVTTMVIMVISGNLVLSLGMVGALSIIRFRAAIKDPLDIVYMFWAVGVGIANGVGYFQVSIISSVFIGLVMLWAKSIPTKARAQLLVVKLDGSYKTILDSTLSDLSKYNIKSQNYTDDSVEVVYEILEALSAESINKISTIKEVVSVRLINYTGNR